MQHGAVLIRVFLWKGQMEELLDAKDVRKILKCSLSLVYQMAEREQIPCVRWEAPGKGRKKTMVRFKLEDIQGFIERNYQ